MKKKVVGGFPGNCWILGVIAASVVLEGGGCKLNDFGIDGTDAWGHPGSGGRRATGGSDATGGAPVTGGVSGAGGAPATGGSVGGSGASETGGSAPSQTCPSNGAGAGGLGANGDGGDPGQIAVPPSFALTASYALAENPESVALGDVNSDGWLDIAFTNWGHDSGSLGSVRVLVNNGDGTFAADNQYGWTEARAISVALGDLTGDGRLDVAVASSGYAGRFASQEGALALLPNSGSGSFGPRRQYSAGPSANFVALGDLNGDGKPDIAVAKTTRPTSLGGTPDPRPGSVGVFLNDGTGVLGPQAEYGSGVDYYAVAVGDLNGDHRADLAAAGSEGVSVFLNRGDGTFSPPAVLPFPAGSIAVDDLNRDGSPDLIVTTGVVACAPNTTCPSTLVGCEGVIVFLNRGDGRFAVPRIYAAGADPRGGVIGDVNGDGTHDVVVVNSQTNTVTILASNGAGILGAPISYPAGSLPSAVSLGDLNGDQKTDLVVVNFVGGVHVLMNTSP